MVGVILASSELKQESKRGRPRDPRVRAAILQATLEAITNRCERLSIESVAAGAGVSKKTVYHWWDSRGTLLLDALAEYAKSHVSASPTRVSENPLESLVKRTVKSFGGTIGEVLRGLVVEAQINEGFRSQLRERLIDMRRAEMQAILFSQYPGASVSSEILLDKAYGAIWYRLLVSFGPLDETFARELFKSLDEELREDA